MANGTAALPPTQPPPRWMLVLGPAPRAASDTDFLVPQKPPDASYVNAAVPKGPAFGFLNYYSAGAYASGRHRR